MPWHSVARGCLCWAQPVLKTIFAQREQVKARERSRRGRQPPVETGPRNQGLDSAPVSCFVGPAASPCSLLGGPCVKGGVTETSGSRGSRREPRPSTHRFRHRAHSPLGPPS